MEAKNTSTRPKEVYNDSKVERDASELYSPRASLVAQIVKNLPAMQDTWV